MASRKNERSNECSVCVCVGDVEDERGNEQYEALTCSFMLIKRSPAAAASVSEKLKGEEKTKKKREKKRMGSFSMISLDFSPFPYK
jgi:hypothetical protein